MSTLALKVPPPLVALIAAAGMWMLNENMAFGRIDVTYKTLLCYLLVAIGLIVDFLAVWQFRRLKTTVNPLKPSKASTLATTGIYQFSRNPMYLGNLIFLSAWLIWLGLPFNVVFLAVYVSYMNRFQIKVEERILEGLFGADYNAYCAHVRRWV